MKIAIVYDRVNKTGGAERILAALHDIWPDAPLYTAVYSPKGAPWVKNWKIIPSFLQLFPLARSHHELYPWATSFAFESFSFDSYDVVLSVTSAEAKSIITKPKTLHICYCLTPTRYLWSGVEEYRKDLGGMIFIPPFSSLVQKTLRRLRRWDLISAKRPDYYIAISNHVKNRIETYYNEKSISVIYPPLDMSVFVPGRTHEKGAYDLVVSRFVGYKRLDVVIEAYNRLGLPLVVVGSGRSEYALRSRAKKNIRFVTRYLTDRELVGYYQKCRAFVFAGDEDFGLVASEAQACGKSVLAYINSGISEIVVDGLTGILYDKQTVDSFILALRKLHSGTFSPKACRENARRFSQGKFMKEMKENVEFLYKKHSIL